MQWLCEQIGPDARWHLVHATHSEPAEIAQVAASGASVVICPGTEGNLGDGLCDLPGWLKAGVPISLGSDSHVTRGWVEELRWLEYGQRLGLQQRNVAAAPGREPSTAARLFEAGTVDFVFIDAGHTREAVAADIAAWLPKVRPGGRIAGHDYAPEWPGVVQAVDECLGGKAALFPGTRSCWHLQL